MKNKKPARKSKKRCGFSVPRKTPKDTYRY